MTIRHKVGHGESFVHKVFGSGIDSSRHITQSWKSLIYTVRPLNRGAYFSYLGVILLRYEVRNNLF